MEQRIAAGIKQRRDALSLSVNDLALRSGVSRAMISKIERVEASPTAALLGRLCNALGITLSSLIASAESAPSLPLSRAKRQLSWRDPETGLKRTMVSPVNTGSRVEIVQLELPPNASVAYERQQVTQYEQHILVLDGTLTVTTEGQDIRLDAGDCLFRHVGPAHRFANGTRRSCRYLVVIGR
jgi:transcriptional regulator with XRE-family HTH domain